MKRILTTAVVLLVLCAPLLAKGVTTRITFARADPGTPIEVTDARLVQVFNVWSGPGTSVNDDPQAEGFIGNWASGPVPRRPEGLTRFEVSFFVKFHGRPVEELAYVVDYECDSSQGFVFIPGYGDARYRRNVHAIFRGIEGNWFRATPEWQRFAASQVGGPCS
jgi:hypothetical protein